MFVEYIKIYEETICYTDVQEIKTEYFLATDTLCIYYIKKTPTQFKILEISECDPEQWPKTFIAIVEGLMKEMGKHELIQHIYAKANNAKTHRSR